MGEAGGGEDGGEEPSPRGGVALGQQVWLDGLQEQAGAPLAQRRTGGAAGETRSGAAEVGSGGRYAGGCSAEPELPQRIGLQH